MTGVQTCALPISRNNIARTAADYTLVNVASPIDGSTIPFYNVSTAKAIPDPGIRLYNSTCTLHCNLASTTTATFYTGELVVQEK